MWPKPASHLPYFAARHVLDGMAPWRSCMDRHPTSIATRCPAPCASRSGRCTPYSSLLSLSTLARSSFARCSPCCSRRRHGRRQAPTAAVLALPCLHSHSHSTTTSTSSDSPASAPQPSRRTTRRPPPPACPPPGRLCMWPARFGPQWSKARRPASAHGPREAPHQLPCRRCALLRPEQEAPASLPCSVRDQGPRAQIRQK